MDVTLETGQKKTFASALDWPGWSRSGRGEDAALQALFAYGTRYAHALRGTRLGFRAPENVSDFTIVERLEGNATTDFGAPGAFPARDADPVDQAELKNFQTLLQACWRAFDGAVAAAASTELRKGPHGGGRSRDGIVAHVTGADASYLSRLGWTFKVDEAADPQAELRRTREAILEALPPAMRGELPARGPRGGLRWSVRYTVRRSAWHVLDHAWEIEDRAT